MLLEHLLVVSLVDEVVLTHAEGRPKKDRVEIVLVDAGTVEFERLAGLKLVGARHGKGIELLELSN